MIANFDAVRLCHALYSKFFLKDEQFYKDFKYFILFVTGRGWILKLTHKFFFVFS